MTDAGRRLLAIEAATDRLSIALFEGDVVRAMCFAPGLRRHAAELLPTLEAILDEAGVGLEAVDAIAVSSGPGSFTSLRIGLSTVKGLAFGRAVETIGVSTLETMAFGALAGAGDVAVGDEWSRGAARCATGKTYAGGFARGAGTLPECVLAEGSTARSRWRRSWRIVGSCSSRRRVEDWCRDFAPRAGGAVRVSCRARPRGRGPMHSVGSRSGGWIGARASRRVRSPRALSAARRRPRRSGSGSRRRRGWPPGSTSPTSARAGCVSRRDAPRRRAEPLRTLAPRENVA
ncbi:MAG: tRNA (adenosine(37)-N6)-threonylcarbamoyltransferase complex dimerization subunit type 1 TsaB [Myxococcota bacterium]